MSFLNSIRGRLILSLMTGILFVVMLILLLSSFRYENMTVENRGELLSQLSSGMAYQLSQDMHSRTTEIQMLTNLPDIQSFDVSLEQKRAIFERMRKSYPYYAWIGMTDAKGNILTGTQGLLVGKNVFKRSWFMEGAKGPHLGSVHDAFLLSKIMPKPKWDDLPLRLVDVSAPIRDKNGNLLGVICGHLGWDWAFEMRDKILASPNLANIDLLVAKSDGALLMGTAHLPSNSVDLSQYDFFKQALKNRNGIGFETWSDQQAYLTASSYESSASNNMLKWVVLAREKKSIVMADFWHQVKISILIAFAVILLLIAIVYRIVSKSLQPLEKLSEVAQAIYSGNKQIKIPLFKKQDEVGILSRSFKILVDFLQKEIHQKTVYADQLRLMGRVYESSPQSVMITDINKHIVDVNEAFTKMTGYQKTEVIGQTPSILSSGRQDRAFYEQMWLQICNEGLWQGEIWNKNKDGDIYPEWLLITCLKNEEGELTHFIGIFSDMSDKKEAEKQLVFLANHDVLTQLPNRRLLQDHVNLALNQGGSEQSGLIFLDLDFFKSINDSLGHFVGDKLLVALARSLSQAFKKPNLVARFGGDEFVIFVPDLSNVNEMEKIASQIDQLFSTPFMVGDYSLQVGASMGISLYPQDGQTAEELIQAADTAMYSIKGNHKASYQFYTREMYDAAYQKLLLERDLKQALIHDEFYLVYQPQIDLETSKLNGLETLIRWEHPERGIVSPMLFIPVLEEMGLIDRVGLWVLEEALAQYKTWLKEFAIDKTTLSVNLSALQFRDPNIVKMLKNAVSQSGVECEHVIFEVTESVMLADDLRLQKDMEALKKSGCRFALDDYGTGYSGLSYIDRYQFSELKIDQAFVRKMMEKEFDQLIVHHTIKMAKSLGMSVVIEGVETPQQIEFLGQYQGLIIQGYYFSKPLTADEFTLRLQNNQDNIWQPDAFQNI